MALASFASFRSAPRDLASSKNAKHSWADLDAFHKQPAGREVLNRILFPNSGVREGADL